MKNSEESIAGNANEVGIVCQQINECSHRETLAREE